MTVGVWAFRDTVEGVCGHLCDAKDVASLRSASRDWRRIVDCVLVSLRPTSISSKLLQSKALPGLKSLHIDQLYLLQPQQLRCLSTLTQLTQLSLGGPCASQLRSHHLDFISCLTNLQELSIRGCPKVHLSIVSLWHPLTQLRSLTLIGFAFSAGTDATHLLSFLAAGAAASLSCLVLGDSQGLSFLSDRALQGLGALMGPAKALRVLDLSGCIDITDAGIQQLAGLQQLQQLQLHNCMKVNAGAVPVLASLTSLTQLSLRGCSQFSDQHLQQLLLRLTALQHLNLQSCGGLGGAFLTPELCRGLAHLKTLNLSYCQGLRPECISQLSSLVALRRLELSGCGAVSGVPVLLLLGRLTQLRELVGSHWRLKGSCSAAAVAAAAAGVMGEECNRGVFSSGILGNSGNGGNSSLQQQALLQDDVGLLMQLDQSNSHCNSEADVHYSSGHGQSLLGEWQKCGDGDYGGLGGSSSSSGGGSSSTQRLRKKMRAAHQQQQQQDERQQHHHHRLLLQLMPPQLQLLQLPNLVCEDSLLQGIVSSLPSSLTSLDLSNCRVPGFGAAGVCLQGLRRLGCLARLNLSGSTGGVVASALSFLSGMTGLAELQLDHVFSEQQQQQQHNTVSSSSSSSNDSMCMEAAVRHRSSTSSDGSPMVVSHSSSGSSFASFNYSMAGSMGGGSNGGSNGSCYSTGAPGVGVAALLQASPLSANLLAAAGTSCRSAGRMAGAAAACTLMHTVAVRRSLFGCSSTAAASTEQLAAADMLTAVATAAATAAAAAAAAASMPPLLPRPSCLQQLQRLQRLSVSFSPWLDDRALSSLSGLVRTSLVSLELIACHGFTGVGFSSWMEAAGPGQSTAVAASASAAGGALPAPAVAAGWGGPGGAAAAGGAGTQLLQLGVPGVGVQLTRLNFTGCSGLTDEGLKCLVAALAGGGRQQQQLHEEGRQFLGNSAAAAAAVAEIAAGAAAVPERTVGRVGACGVRELLLAGCRHVRDEGVAALAALTSLRLLSLSSNRDITSRATGALFPSLRHLRHIQLGMCSGLDDSALNHLAAAPALTTADMRGCWKITDSGVYGLLCHSASLLQLNVECCHRLSGSCCPSSFQMMAGDGSTRSAMAAAAAAAATAGINNAVDGGGSSSTSRRPTLLVRVRMPPAPTAAGVCGRVLGGGCVSGSGSIGSDSVVCNGGSGIANMDTNSSGDEELFFTDMSALAEALQ